MNLVSLTEVAHTLIPGVVLRWGVRDQDGRLLLAKGHLLPDQKAIDALLGRGVYIDKDEASTPNEAEKISNANMVNRWGDLEGRLTLLLKSATEKYFLQKAAESIGSIASLSDANSDLLIYLIMRHDYSRFINYGVIHSIHCAALGSLLTRRLNWPEERRQSLIGAALTMNIVILDLQGQLASNGSKPTGVEQKVIDTHPIDSANLLRSAGLTDQDWLNAVEQHHEFTGGSGYPKKVTEQTEMARLLGFIDRFTAKHSPRKGRLPLPSQTAAREIYMQGAGDPFAALLIKEFGIYPPGAYVELKSGECAIVTHRGKNANEPFVAAYTNALKEPILQPVRRDTSNSKYAIAKTIFADRVKVRVSVGSLYGN